jgi:hypothetical protein
MRDVAVRYCIGYQLLPSEICPRVVTRVLERGCGGPRICPRVVTRVLERGCGGPRISVVAESVCLSVCLSVTVRLFVHLEKGVCSLGCSATAYVRIRGL